MEILDMKVGVRAHNTCLIVLLVAANAQAQVPGCGPGAGPLHCKVGNGNYTQMWPTKPAGDYQDWLEPSTQVLYEGKTPSSARVCVYGNSGSARKAVVYLQNSVAGPVNPGTCVDVTSPHIEVGCYVSPKDPNKKCSVISATCTCPNNSSTTAVFSYSMIGWSTVESNANSSNSKLATAVQQQASRTLQPVAASDSSLMTIEVCNQAVPGYPLVVAVSPNADNSDVELYTVAAPSSGWNCISVQGKSIEVGTSAPKTAPESIYKYSTTAAR